MKTAKIYNWPINNINNNSELKIKIFVDFGAKVKLKDFSTGFNTK